MEIIVNNINELEAAAKSFIKFIKENRIRVYCFNGVMGAGKTTFIKSICEQLGVNDVINSPTFSIVNEYETADNEIIYHFDCYRIKTIEEAINFGAEEYLYSGNLCFIEWSENINQLLPNDLVEVDIQVVDDNKRIIKW